MDCVWAGGACNVDAHTLVHRLNVSRAFVYEHAAEQGAIPLGTGPRPRLRFDLEKALALPVSSPAASLKSGSVGVGNRFGLLLRMSGDGLVDAFRAAGRCEFGERGERQKSGSLSGSGRQRAHFSGGAGDLDGRASR